MYIRWRPGFVGLFPLLIVLVGIFPSAAPVDAASAASAASAAPATPNVVFGPPTIVKHVILNELSIDGPSLLQYRTRSGPQSGRGLVLAWTGTDHRLNTLESYDNFATHIPKTTFNETSFFRPAIAPVTDGGEALAWVGTNSSRSLNVLCRGCGSTGGWKKLTFWNETSFAAPALIKSGSKLWLAWAGTDANHSLNLLPIDWTTFKPGTKTILRQFSSIASPSLSPYKDTGLLLTWAATSPLHRIRFAISTDTVHWTQPASSPLAEWTAVAPSLLSLGVANMPPYYLGWTGTDSHHSVNVQYTESFPTWPLDNSKTTFGEWALGGPALADSLVGRQIVLAWTGTDPLHRLNIALIGV